MTIEEQKMICDIFEIPEVASDLLEFFFDSDELQFILDIEHDTFQVRDVGEEFVNREYKRGLISKTDETGNWFKLNNFYYFLDVFVVGRKNKYDELSDNKKKSLDRWYFNAYYATLDKTLPQPTTDKVLPMEEMIQKIDADDRPIYLNYCDCRSLTGECGLPTRTCITYKNGINSFVDRGLSEQIDKERAKEIIRETDRVGLMHTVAMGGICNCCGDCCYLFRSLKRLDSAGRWPLSEYIAQLNEEKCKKDN